MRKIITLVLILLAVIPCKTAIAKPEPNSLSRLNSRYIVVMDWESGRILFEKDSRVVTPMASTTKIMTAVIALENSSLKDIVTVSKRASSIHGSTIGLKDGQKVTMEELLYGLMMRSGNDCAIAIAEHIGGSVEGFAELMNSKAFDIGAFNTHFSTPHGLDADGHFTTALDLALLTRYALKNETFCKIVSARDAIIDGAGGPRKFNNINKILWSVEGADGVKTGYTGKAGKCLVASATRNGRKVISVVINSSSRWEDSKKLLNYGLNNFKNKIVVNSKDYWEKVNVSGGDKFSIRAGISSDIDIPLADSEGSLLSTRAFIYDDIKAPVFRGQVVGRLVVYTGDKEIYSVPIRSNDEVKKLRSRNFFKGIIENLKDK